MSSEWLALPPGTLRFAPAQASHVAFAYGDELEMTHVHVAARLCRLRHLASRQSGLAPLAFLSCVDAPPAAAPVASPGAAAGVSPADSAALGAADEALRAWGLELRRAVTSRDLPALAELRARLAALDEARRAVAFRAADVGPADAAAARVRLAEEISAGARALGLDVLPRLPGGSAGSGPVASVLTTGASSLLDLHAEQDPDCPDETKRAARHPASSQQQQQQQQTDELSAAANPRSSVMLPPRGLAGTAPPGTLKGSQRLLLAAAAAAAAASSSAGAASSSFSMAQRQEAAASTMPAASASVIVARAARSIGAADASMSSSTLRGSSSFSDLLQQSGSTGGLVQIWVQVWLVLIDIGCEFELRAALYDKSTGTYVSEDWLAMFDADCQPLDRQREPGSYRALFRDVPLAVLCSGELFLTVRVLRRGHFTQEGRAKSKPENPLRRPFGAGVLRLDTSGVSEGQCAIYMCQEPAFGTLPEALAAGVGEEAGVKPIPKSKGVVFNIRPLICDHAEACKSNPSLTYAADTVDPLRVPEAVMPGTVRNDLYLTLEDADFPEKNTEAVVSVRRNADARVAAVLTSAPGERPTETQRSVVLATSTPFWRETYRARFDDLQACNPVDMHIFIEFRHYSSSEPNQKMPKPFAYSFLLLGESGTIIKDGTQKLPLYKYPTKSSDIPAHYLFESPDRKEIGRSFINITTRLSSTFLTANGTHTPARSQSPDALTPRAHAEHLNKLFNWRLNVGALQDTLKKLTFLNNDEIVRHLEQIFQALFEILSQSEDINVQHTVYDAILFTIAKLTESRSSWNFRPVLNCYVAQRYRGTDQHEPLLRALSASFTNLDAPHKVQAVSSSLKSLDYLFAIIIQSRQNHNAQNAVTSQRDDEFRQALRDFLRTFNQLMAKQSKTLILAQAYAFKHFPFMLKGMSKYFSNLELCELAADFLRVSDHLSGLHKLNDAKLRLYHALATSDLLQEQDQRQCLLPLLLQYITAHLAHVVADLDAKCAPGCLSPPPVLSPRASFSATSSFVVGSDGPAAESSAREDTTEHKLSEGCRCSDIVGALVDSVQVGSHSMRERSAYADALLPTLRQFCALHGHLLRRGGSGTLGVMTTVLSIVRLASADDWEAFLAPMASDDELLACLRPILEILRDSVSGNGAYPKRWGTLVAWQHSVVLKLAMVLEGSPRVSAALDALAAAAQPSDETARAWLAYLELCAGFCESPLLSACSQATRERYGDMRSAMGAVLSRVWARAAPRYLLFQPLIGRSIRLMNVAGAPSSLARDAIAVYHATLEAEFAATGDIALTRRETVAEFDRAAFQDSFAQFFFNALRERLEASATGLMPKAMAFIEEVRSYIELICKYEATPKDPQNCDDRIEALHELIDYLRSHARTDALAKYAEQLYSLHVGMGNWTEAGLALALQATACDWAAQPPASPAGPSPSRAREQVLRQSIAAFERGSDYESCLPVLCELQARAETSGSRDCHRVAGLLREQASLCRKAAEQERIPEQYYRVAFYGGGFGPVLRGREFVYKAKQLEKLPDFQQRLQQRHPRAELLRRTDTPGPDVVGSAAGQFMLITPVVSSAAPPPPAQGEGEGKAEGGGDDGMDGAASGSVFLYAKAFRKESQQQRKDENEFAGLWLDHLYLRTREAFPGTRTRSEVVARRQARFTPLEHAVRAVADKTAELAALVARCEARGASDQPTLQRLLMALNGVIVAGVNGGIPKYKEAFLGADYAAARPGDAGLVAELRAAIAAQVDVLERGVAVHGALCGAEMREMHKVLAAKLDEMRRALTAEITSLLRSGVVTATPPQSQSQPPTPLDPATLRGKGPLQMLRERPYLVRLRAKSMELIDAKKSLGQHLDRKPWWHEAFEPTHECVLGEDRLGVLGDGGKWVCGMAAFSRPERGEPCVVYSMGSNGQWDFEQAILELSGGRCEVHTFDKDNFEPPDARIKFHKTFVGGRDDPAANTKSVRTIMRELGHSRVSILKADIEAQEFPVMQQIADMSPLPRFDVVLLEVHGFQLGNDRAEGLSTTAQLFRNLEKLGLYVYHREANVGCAPCSEYAFARPVLDD
eukprot:m51a1_g14199 putative dedicator of cytokinesis protein 4 (2069) ;mRNA; r:125563-134282